MTFRSPKQLAADTGIPLSQIYRLVQMRKVAVVRSSERGPIAIADEDWDAYIARHRVPARGERETPRAMSRERLIAQMEGSDRYLT